MRVCEIWWSQQAIPPCVYVPVALPLRFSYILILCSVIGIYILPTVSPPTAAHPRRVHDEQEARFLSSAFFSRALSLHRACAGAVKLGVPDIKSAQGAASGPHWIRRQMRWRQHGMEG